jgi:hypothetical protein
LNPKLISHDIWTVANGDCCLQLRLDGIQDLLELNIGEELEDERWWVTE